MYSEEERPSTACLWFGKHKGVPLPEVDTGYLQWALRTVKLSSGIRQAVAAELERRGATVPPPAVNENACWRGPCGRCGGSVRYEWQEFSNGTKQIRATCRACGGSCGHAPRVEPFITEANRNASPTASLTALVLAAEEGVQLLSDGKRVQPVPYDRASQRLRELVRQECHLLAGLLGDNMDFVPLEKRTAAERTGTS